MQEVRITLAVATLLRVFLDEPNEPCYGYELMRRTGFASGKLYPILARLEHAGWLAKQREDVEPAEAGRPVRRLYRLTPDGAQAARLELAMLHEQLTARSTARPSTRPNPAAGLA
jgi:PadR family transcriptional regulator, regulatory protein PadR